MRFKIYLFIILFSQLFSFIGSKESPLRFIDFDYPKSIIIPSNIDYDDFEVVCKINYRYEGDWIGGCGSEKICMICRDYEVCAKLLYLDKNEKELYILNLGKAFYCFKKYDLPIECEGGHEIFVFRDNIVYNHEMKILSPRFFELKGLKELIRLKKIYKIKITLKKVLLDWEYTCTKRDFKKREDINETKIEGKYEFDIGKTYFVNVEYEKKVNNEDLKVIK